MHRRNGMFGAVQALCVCSFLLLCFSVNSNADSDGGLQVPFNLSVYRDLKAQFSYSYANASDSLLRDRFVHQLGAKHQRTPSGWFAARKRFGEHTLLYDLFASQEEVQPTQHCVDDLCCVGVSCWKDLRLFCGDVGSRHANLVARIDRSQTSMGSVYLTRLLAMPSYDKVEIERRQTVIKQFMSDANFYVGVRSELSKISSFMPTLLSFWDSKSHVCRVLAKLDKFYVEQNSVLRFVGLDSKFAYLDSSQSALLGYGLLWPVRDHLAGIAFNAFLTVNGVLDAVYGFRRQGLGIFKKFAFSEAGSKALWATVYLFASRLFGNIIGAVCEGKKCWRSVRGIGEDSVSDDCVRDLGGDEVSTRAVLGLLQAPLGALGLGMSIYDILKDIRALRDASSVVSKLSCFVEACESLNILTSEPLAYRDGLILHPKIVEFLDGVGCGKLQDLLDAVSAVSCKGGEYNYARVLKVYKLLHDLKDEFVGLLEAIGEIDAYCSLATLMRENINCDNKFCFVSCEQSNDPHIALDGVWDPFIDSCDAISNDIEFGGSLKRHGAIISGPNAGGKSTFMRAVLFAAMMGQSCGICAARGASLTPFSYFDSYVNVEDDPASKKSLFRAEAAQVTSLLNNVDALPTGHHALVIVDEMFRGTNPRDASCIARAVCRAAAEKEQSFWVISSHLPSMTSVEKDSGGVFNNFHVGVERDSNGKFNRFTYKILPGTTRESTAFDVLEQVGVDTSVITYAREIRKVDGRQSMH